MHLVCTLLNDSAKQNWRNFRPKLDDEVLQGDPRPHYLEVHSDGSDDGSRRVEIPATSCRSQKWEFQNSAGARAGTGACKNGGAGRSAGTGAGRLGPLGKQRQDSLPAPVPALRPAPPFLQAPVPARAPALFWNSHFWLLHEVAGISTLSLVGHPTAICDSIAAIPPWSAL